MDFWGRLFAAVVCWFLTMIALITVASYYLVPLAPFAGLGPAVLRIIIAGVGTVVVLTGILAFWLWIWARKYW